MAEAGGEATLVVGGDRFLVGTVLWMRITVGTNRGIVEVGDAQDWRVGIGWA